MKLEEMTPELIEQAKVCKTMEERMAFLKANRIELTPEQAEQVGGGSVYTAGSSFYNSQLSCSGHHKKMYYTGKMWERPLFGFITCWTEHMNQYYCPDCGNYYEVQEDIYDKKPGDLYFQ